MKILIVEDDFLSRKLMLSYLAPLGQCDVASNGSEAMEAFTLAHKEKEPYDLITLDIMMPDLSGQEVLKRVRAYEEEKQILFSDGRVKVIMTTALKDGSNVMDAFKNQCEGYLVKPIDSDELMALINQ
ncbi:MAG: response regulator [Thermodesulfobacteriota bacterium]|nr:response regulator [Thermodesulfobacteriota bacterium]